MTTYAATVTFGAVTTLSIVPSSTYQVRVAKVEVTGATQYNVSYSLYVYASNAATGGTLLTPLAMRAGSPASTASARYNATISGSPYLLHQESVFAGVPDNLGNVQPVAMNSSYTFPFDLILRSGSTFAVSVSPGSTGSTSAIIYYEELRLAWSS